VTDAPTERAEAGIIARLRQRKVVQWSLAYAAGAWGLLQGLGYVSGLYDWPRQYQQLALLLVLLGFPIALTLAWYHGDRGEQRVSRVELAIVTLLFVLGGGVFWRSKDATVFRPAAAPVAAPASAVTSTDSRPSIAVLPFENRSDEHNDAFFVDGIHDDVLTQLSKVSALRVISRTSVEQFRRTRLPTRSIAQQLGVTSILEGGVQRVGERVRINVQLINASTDAHLWAETYDRELTAENIFAIQTEVATAIAAALRATLTAAEKSRVDGIPTRNLEAWEAYQRGKQSMVDRTSIGMRQAVKHFERAIELDPNFALAYVGLADSLAIRPVLQAGRTADVLTRAEKAAETARRLDPNLGEAWTSSGLVAKQQGQFDRAETMFRKAIELNPNYAPANQWYSALLSDVGRPQESLTFLRKAVALDPLAPILNLNLGETLCNLGQFDEAEAAFRRTIEIEPTMADAYSSLALFEAYARARLAVAIPLMQRASELDPDSQLFRLLLASLYDDVGDDDTRTRIMQDASSRWPDDEYVLLEAAHYALHRGDWGLVRQNAQRALKLDPRSPGALRMLRNDDFRNRRYGSARDRYAAAYPEFFAATPPTLDVSNLDVAVDLALVLQKSGDGARAGLLLKQAKTLLKTRPRLGAEGSGLTDVEIYAIEGKNREALAALHEAVNAGFRGFQWRSYRDVDPALEALRDDPAFKAAFAEIERDTARQRAELAARPKDAPLELKRSGA
jgi:TolB-like protein/Flp pilus assembly protein TadD